MKRSLMVCAAGCLMALALSATMTRAQGTSTKAPASPKPAAPAKAAKAPSGTLKCPACGMPMGAAKSASAPTAIKINGKVYYCCSGCPAGQQAVAYAKAHKGAIMSMNTSKTAPKKGMTKKS